MLVPSSSIRERYAVNLRRHETILNVVPNHRLTGHSRFTQSFKLTMGMSPF
jgi:hypothetical protein